YSPFGSDTAAELSERKQCADVYVSGTYSESLTIASEDDVIINGNIYPTSVEGKLGSEPSGTATLGLIATNFVRVYHPVKTGGTNTESSCNEENLKAKGTGSPEDPNGWGSLSELWIYAA